MKFETSRLTRLLNMEYTPTELAAELNTTVRQIRAAIDQDAPHRQTAGGHVFVNGADFAHWVRQQSQARQRQRLDPNQAYCFKCRSAVPLTVVTVTATNGNSELAKGVCPLCGSLVNRARRRER